MPSSSQSSTSGGVPADAADGLPSEMPTDTLTGENPLANHRPNSGETAAESASQNDIPSGSLAIFYSDVLSSIEEYVALNIKWERTDKGVIRYIPAAGRWDVMGSTSSTDYSKTAIYQLTSGGRFFTITDYGGDWTAKSKGFLIAEKDPKTAVLITQVSITAETFAIVGNQIFYRDEAKMNLYGDYSSGGDLKRYSFGSNDLPATLLSYDDPHNKGLLFGIGEHLISVINDGTTMSVREHGLTTGKMIKTLHDNIPFHLGEKYAMGENGLYRLWQEGKKINIEHFPLSGPATLVMDVDLEGEEMGVDLDENGGKLVLFAYKPGKISERDVYDLASGKLEEKVAEEITASLKEGSLYGFGPQIMVME